MPWWLWLGTIKTSVMIPYYNHSLDNVVIFGAVMKSAMIRFDSIQGPAIDKDDIICPLNTVTEEAATAYFYAFEHRKITHKINKWEQQVSKPKVFPHSWFIPERGVNILILLLLAACHYLPGTSTIWILERRCMWMDTEGAKWAQSKEINVFTLHGSHWIVDH